MDIMPRFKPCLGPSYRFSLRLFWKPRCHKGLLVENGKSNLIYKHSRWNDLYKRLLSKPRGIHPCYIKQWSCLELRKDKLEREDGYHLFHTSAPGVKLTSLIMVLLTLDSNLLNLKRSELLKHRLRSSFLSITWGLSNMPRCLSLSGHTVSEVQG